MASILEIREFVDERGELINHELVDIDAEMRGMLSKVEQLQAAKKAEAATRASGEEKPGDNLDFEGIKKSIQDSMNPPTEPLDDEMRFIREIAEIADASESGRNPRFGASIAEEEDDDDAWLLDLERLEHSGASLSPKAATTSQRPPDANKSTTSDSNSSTSSTETLMKSQTVKPSSKASQSGWKKGFLGSGSSKSATSSTNSSSSSSSSSVNLPKAKPSIMADVVVEKSQPQLPAPLPMPMKSAQQQRQSGTAAASSPAGAAASAANITAVQPPIPPASTSRKVSFGSEIASSPTEPKPASAPAKPVSRPKAFTGSIVERFP